MIERCGDRQRKLEGLKRWPLDTFVESLPVMLQIALLLLACGLCRHMVSINAPIFGVLIALTGLGILFYFGIVISGTSSYECPFQTPASAHLRDLWEKAGSLSKLWKGIWSKILHVAYCFPCTSKLNPRNHSRSSSLPTTRDSVFSQEMDPWLIPGDLAVFRRNNANDIRCVSWILRNITDPESLDAAVRLAGTIRWFEEGIDVEPPYDMILSIFESCLDSTKKVYPGMKERAYYSIRAILWIYVLAGCKSPGRSHWFTLPVVSGVGTPSDDLTHLLSISFHICPQTIFPRPVGSQSVGSHIISAYNIPHGVSYAHARWASNLLLHLTWIKLDHQRTTGWFIQPTTQWYQYIDLNNIPLDATLNYFLVWCTLLGSLVEEEALKIQDKSYVISCFFFQVTHAAVH